MVILDTVVVGLGLGDGGVQRALVGQNGKVGSSRTTVVARTCDGHGGGACLRVVRVGHGVVGVQDERGLAVHHGDSRRNCTARIGLVGDGLNPCVLQVLRISHHYPHVSFGHGERPRAVGLVLRYSDVAHQTGVIASTCEDFRSSLPRGIGANGHILCRVAVVGSHADGHHVTLLCLRSGSTAHGEGHRAVCLAASGQRQVVLRGGGGNGPFSKHVLGSASAIVATFAVIIIKNRSRIVSTIIQLHTYAESQCAVCTGTASHAVSTATDACANATRVSASTTGCCNSTTVYIDCAACTAAFFVLPANAAATDACATATASATVAAGCCNSTTVYIDCAACTAAFFAVPACAAATDTCATATAKATVAAGCCNSTTVYIDYAACTAACIISNTDATDACVTAKLGSPTSACSGKCARAGALCVDVKRCICGCDARACCKLRTITKNKVYCTADRNTTADGKTTFRYNIPRTVSPAGCGRFKFGCVHGLRGSVPVNIADAGGIRRQAHAGEKPE